MTGQKNYKFGKKNVKVVEFRDHIWNHHEKCMPGIGSLIGEIAVKM